MGIAGLITINSGSPLEICRIETVCPPLLVTKTVAAELVVFTVTDPNLSDEGLTPTPAWTGTGKNIAPERINPRDKYTNGVLCMRGQSFVFDLLAKREREGGVPFGAQYFYGQYEDMSCGSLRLLALGSD